MVDARFGHSGIRTFGLNKGIDCLTAIVITQNDLSEARHLALALDKARSGVRTFVAATRWPVSMYLFDISIY